MFAWVTTEVMIAAGVGFVAGYAVGKTNLDTKAVNFVKGVLSKSPAPAAATQTTV